MGVNMHFLRQNYGKEILVLIVYFDLIYTLFLVSKAYRLFMGFLCSLQFPSVNDVQKFSTVLFNARAVAT